LIAALSVTLFVGGFVGWQNPEVLWSSHIGPGAFYKLMPHNTIALIFGAVFIYAILAACLSVRNFWRDGEMLSHSSGGLWQAIKDAGSLRYLDGGGGGCYGENEKPTDNRKLYHHMTFYGFVLCFAATSIATLYHYLLGREAPYPWYDFPVILGTLGGIGLLLGPAGLLHAKWSRAREIVDETRHGMEVAFLAMLFFTSLTGLVLLFLRETPAMGILLALHMGVVFALFLTMPYGKFMHGLYRFAALVKHAQEREGENHLSHSTTPCRSNGQ
jgi:citrate/tricarballylate utilization protein